MTAPVEVSEYVVLPGEKRAAFTLALEWGTVRIEDKVCIATAQWMTLPEARAMAAAVFELASEEE